MDVWFFAAAAGAGYLAQRLKNINHDKHKLLTSKKNLNVLKQEVPAVLPKIQDNMHKLYRVLSSENLGEYDCTEKESACQDALGPEMVSTDEFQSETLAEDASSSTIVLSDMEGDCGGRVFIDDTDDSSPQPSSIELLEERAEIEESVSSVNLSNQPTTRPFHVTDESSLISREPRASCYAAWRCKLLKKTQSEENNDVLGVPRLPKAVPMELQGSTKGRTEKKHTPRRNNSSTMMNGNQKIAQGSSDGTLLFYLGLTMGMVSSFLKNKREMEKLDKLLRQKENLVQDLQEELEMKDSLTVKELAVEDYESQDNSCDQMAEESLSKIEAELEAELERLESNMNLTRFEAKLPNVTELDPDFVSDVTEWELRADLFDAKKDARLYTNRQGRSPPSAQYPISPRELSLRLHEVIQSRLEERVVELEAALANSQRNDIIGTSSSHDSPVPEDEQKSVILNLSGETLVPYTEAYEELMKVSESDDEDIPFPFEERNGNQDNMTKDVDMVRDNASNVYLECSNGCIETELNLGSVKNLDVMDDVVCDSRDAVEGGGEEEMERLLIRQLVEKARQGSPVVLNAQKALLSIEQIKF
ncbi:uncharacterized protein [Henckelia pumila]|uniref:uncharacterized protein isoform X2 n=1 Tax=Henckelia pumila TaxID=405737 RepID=UPI003C6DE45B